MGCHYINGSFVKRDEEALISISDLGLTRGYGVCDILRTYHKKAFHLYDHYRRLVFSAQEIGLTVPTTFTLFQKIIDRLLKMSPLDEVIIKTLVTGGLSEHRFLPDESASLIISVTTPVTFPEEFYSSGAPVCTTNYKRLFPKSKTLFYIPAILAMKEGEKEGAIEAIHINEKNELLEGITSNFFCFKECVLITSNDENLLHGITRSLVLRLAKGHFPIELRHIPYEEAYEMDEAFLTSCNKEILPVRRIDDIIIGHGSVGPNTKKLMDLFNAYIENEEWPPLHIERHGLKSKRNLPLPS